MGVVFVDTETTGLDPRRHEIWEIALIEEDGTEHLWYPYLYNFREADLIALNIGNFWERYPKDKLQKFKGLGTLIQGNDIIVHQIVELTYGKHLVGAIPSFDAQRLEKLIWEYDMVPGWHYHLIDVEALAIGYLNNSEDHEPLKPPWKSDDIFNALDIDRNKPEFEKHTAMGDARLAKAVYELIMR